MFKKLRNRFIWYTMGLLTLVFAVLFVSMYIFTGNSERMQIDAALQKAIEKPEHGKKSDNPLLTASISVKLDQDTNEVLNVISLTDVDENDIEAAVSEITNRGQSKGFISMNGIRYAYLYWPGNDHDNIALVSSAQYDQTMRSLLFTFLSAGAGALGLLFILSLLFAEKAIKPVREAFNKQKRFIADASHELKTPLTIINTNLDLIKSNGGETVDSQGKWISYISDQTVRMARLIGDMLSLARMDDPSLSLTLSRTDMSALVKRSLLYYEALFYEKKIALKADIAENAHTVADAPALERLTGILLDNALKYTPAGGHVQVLLTSEKARLRLCVSNMHDGLETSQVDRLFDRFYRVSSSRSQQTSGYGLGLAIAKSIAEQHDGKINARLAGGWVKFTVELPVK